MAAKLSALIFLALAATVISQEDRDWDPNELERIFRGIGGEETSEKKNSMQF